MLTVTLTGQVRHSNPSIHHAVPRPRRSDAEAALAALSAHLEALAKVDLGAARRLRKARDTLAVVVATAY